MGFWQNSTHSIHSKVWTFKLRAAPRWPLRDHQLLFLQLIHSIARLSHLESLWQMHVIKRNYLPYRYDWTTGIFTVPIGKAGVYFVNTFLFGSLKEGSHFVIMKSGFGELCRVPVSSNTFHEQGSCSAIVEMDVGG